MTTKKEIVLLFLLVLQQLTRNGLAKKQQEEKMEESFDFIIVGAGSAGCVIANRLSEIKNWKILVLEAGEETTNYFTHIPAMAPTSLFTESIWNYTTEPETENFKGFNKNQIQWQSGKSLGGSSSINFMMYTRGNKEDYDRWGKLGNPGWSYDEVLPYFLKSETAYLGYAEKTYHNTTGLMNIEYSYMSDTAKNFLHTTNGLGFDIMDYNGKSQFGFSPIQATLYRGTRQTAYEAFLKPAKQRGNIKVLTSTEVIKIMFDQTMTKARGVKFMSKGKRIRVLAKKEVIISAGVFNSPKLLMLSGVGPKTHLEQLQIPFVTDLPVGQNLRDHLTYIGLNFLTQAIKTEMDLMVDYVQEIPIWYISGKGILSSLGGLEVIGFGKASNTPNTQTYPDFELLFTSTVINPMFQKIANIKEEIYKKLYKPVDAQIEWSIHPILLHPKSKGHLELKSKNHNEPPIFYPNYFSDPNDMEMMIEAIKFVLNLINTEQFKQNMNLTLNPNPIPGCEPGYEFKKYWECAIKTLTTTASDQFGTCKMGSKDDPESVVDHRFKVHGLDNLRVADASVIPTTISGHLYAATVMIAERLADFIKDDYLNGSGGNNN